MKLIYVVEDHQVIREGVRKYLDSAGYIVFAFANLTTALEAINKTKPDLLIQDVMLPDGDGFDFVQKIRQTTDVPVIFMTAKIAEEDRLKGFALGADDYISKPFSPKELVARVQAILRRVDNQNKVEKTPSQKQYFKADDGVICVDSFEHKVTVNSKTIILTAAEWRIIELLISKRGENVSRSVILEKCFDYSSTSYERIADTHIKNLRAKLGPYPFIETARGYGYKFVAFPVQGA